MKLYFVRHGESTANLLHEFSNTGCKHPLTEAGLAQAHAAARSLAGVEIERIYSSPVLRARQTAEVLAAALQAPLEIAEALREWSVGVYEGTTDPAGWSLHRQVQEDWFERQQWDVRMPGGESLHDIRQRFLPFIEELVAAGQDSERNLLLVAHGGLYMAMLPLVLRNVDRAFAHRHGFPYTSCVVAEAREEGLHCLAWGGEEKSS